MDKIALIVPYFGKLPSFYKAWIKTAEANSTIDFYIFTDDNSIKSHNNIFIKQTSFADFKKKIQEKFDFEIALNHPYKICDFRPAYGIVFEELLKDYDWWGYCDIDLLLGDIRHFLNDSILAKYDRCQLLGHFCIYRNTEKMNNLFKLQEDLYPALNYKDVYTTNESMYFDEGGMHAKCIIDNTSTYFEKTFRDPLEGERKFYYKQKDGNNFVIIWENGKVFSIEKNGNKTELLYAHFFRRRFNIEKCPEQIDKIKIVPTKLFYNSNVIPNDFNFSEKIFYKFSYKLKNLFNSIKKYGVKRTFERHKWSKDYSQHVQKLISNAKNNEDII